VQYRKGRPDPDPDIAGEPEVAARAGEVAEACGGGGSREGAVSVARAERRRMWREAAGVRGWRRGRME